MCFQYLVIVHCKVNLPQYLAVMVALAFQVDYMWVLEWAIIRTQFKKLTFLVIIQVMKLTFFIGVAIKQDYSLLSFD